tara:strand:- start:587 stop:706 length:120 start_codon:yes stop_codon:yes gene_type:complete
MFSSSVVAVEVVLPSVVEEAVEVLYTSKDIQLTQDKLIL